MKVYECTIAVVGSDVVICEEIGPQQRDLDVCHLHSVVVDVRSQVYIDVEFPITVDLGAVGCAEFLSVWTARSLRVGGWD